jgi:hypothetical protein
MNIRKFAIAALVVLPTALSSWSQSAPFENLPDGRIWHIFFGFIFPKQIGMFHREQMHQYNQAGSDVSAGYNAGVLIVATVYAYPAPSQQSADVLSREYASKRTEVLQHGVSVHAQQGVALLSESPVTVSQGGREYSGKRAYFAFRDIFAPDSPDATPVMEAEAHTPQNLKSQLLVFHDGTVFVEYRFTYPRDHADQAEQEVERFIHAWSWRG